MTGIHWHWHGVKAVLGSLGLSSTRLNTLAWNWKSMEDYPGSTSTSLPATLARFTGLSKCQWLPVLVQRLSTGHSGWSEANKGVRAFSKKLHGLHGNIGMPPCRLEANLELESIHNRQLWGYWILSSDWKLALWEKGARMTRDGIVEVSVSKAQRVLGTPRAYCYRWDKVVSELLLLSWRSSWGHPRTAQAQQLSQSCHVMSWPQACALSLGISFCFKMLRLLNLECSMAERRSFRFRLKANCGFSAAQWVC